MTATTHHPSPSPAPGHGATAQDAPVDRAVRFVAVRADLMPAEIISARSAETMRRRVLVGLAAVVAVLVLVYGFSWWQTHSARNDLAAAQSRGSDLNSQTARFAPLVEAQQRTASIHNQLAQLMTGDLSWRTMLTKLRAEAPAGTTLTQVTGAISTDGSTGALAAGGYSALNESGLQQVGTLTLTGTAHDKRSVAAYADRLAGVVGLAAATPTSVTSGTGSTAGSGGVTFTMDVIITSKALGGRYTAAGGTTTTTTTGAAGSTTGGN